MSIVGGLDIHRKHPVPAKRAKGAKKTYLDPDPVQAPVVHRIFALRVGTRLGYQAIADRLNQDPASNPPPEPVDPARAVGRWTASNVREVLTNPKHTGHMVWNRHARKSGRNRANPPDQWVWSPEPTHEPLVDLETFIQAQQIAAHRFGSRTDPGPNRNHPQTRHQYRLRTYLFCTLCSRRMYGRARPHGTYYVCAPRKGYRPDGHPASLWVREQVLLDGLHQFLAHHVFGPYRLELLNTGHATDNHQRRDRDQRIAALTRRTTDLDTRAKQLTRNLELLDADDDLIRDIRTRHIELRQQREALQAQLDELRHHVDQQPNPDLLATLPVGAVDLDQVPAELTRALFEALRLQIHYDKTTNQAVCRITLTGQTAPAAAETARDAVVIPFPQPSRKDDQTMTSPATQSAPPVRILVVPPTGFEPVLPP